MKQKRTQRGEQDSQWLEHKKEVIYFSTLSDTVLISLSLSLPVSLYSSPRKLWVLVIIETVIYWRPVQGVSPYSPNDS